MTNNNIQELYNYNDFYTGESNPIQIVLEQGKDFVQLYKYGGCLHETTSSVLNMIERNSDVEIEYIGQTMKGNDVYKINGELYRAEDCWHCNSETRGYYVKHTAKYTKLFNGFDYEKVLTLSLK